MAHERAEMKKMVEENTKEIESLKVTVQQLQEKDAAQQEEIDDLRNKLVHLLKQEQLKGRHNATIATESGLDDSRVRERRSAATTAAAGLNRTMPARLSRRDAADKHQQQGRSAAAKGTGATAEDAVQPREEDPLEELLRKVERQPQLKRQILQRLGGADAAELPLQRCNEDRRRREKSSPKRDNDRFAFTRRVMQIEVTGTMRGNGSPHMVAAPPPQSEYTSTTRRLIEKARRGSPRGRAADESDQENDYRNAPRDRERHCPVIREVHDNYLSPSSRRYGGDDEDAETTYEKYFRSSAADNDHDYY
ncbi:hypothetical protein AAVH_38771 [Aphelenchoides avenae]|nr:hypothetical protein AAVH_38771 [Aphelenchus avenae]